MSEPFNGTAPPEPDPGMEFVLKEFRNRDGTEKP